MHARSATERERNARRHNEAFDVATPAGTEPPTGGTRAAVLSLTEAAVTRGGWPHWTPISAGEGAPRSRLAGEQLERRTLPHVDHVLAHPLMGAKPDVEGAVGDQTAVARSAAHDPVEDAIVVAIGRQCSRPDQAPACERALSQVDHQLVRAG